MQPNDTLDIAAPAEGPTDLRTFLRDETRAHHDSLDSRMSGLNLETKTGFGAFLATNLVAWSCLHDLWEQFLGQTLRIEAPDYRGLLQQDLDELGEVHSRDVAIPSPVCVPAPEAMAYVLSGSRMGMAHIRKRPNWGAVTGVAGRFIEERTGPDIFRAVLRHLETVPFDAVHRKAALATAVDTFGVFERSLELVRAA